MGYLWTIFQPLLFGLIGAAVDLTEINPKVIGKVLGLSLGSAKFNLAVKLVLSYRQLKNIVVLCQYF